MIRELRFFNKRPDGKSLRRKAREGSVVRSSSISEFAGGGKKRRRRATDGGKKEIDTPTRFEERGV